MVFPTTTAPSPAVHSGTLNVRVRNLEVAYGNAAPSLHSIDLDLWPGEIVAILGRNGAGKTTLLRTIVGLVQPRRGAVEVGGRTTRGRSVADICMEVGYLPQDPGALLFADTVLEEMLITLANHGIQGEAAQQQGQAFLATLGVDRYTNAYPRDLSAGERQRVALAAIAVVGPTTLLLDEPTRGLDYAAKHALADLLRNWRNDGKAIAIVTHDVELAAAIADRVVLLANGEIIADGTPNAVLAASPLFAPQVARLFPGSGWLTAAEALQGLGVEAPMNR